MEEGKCLETNEQAGIKGICSFVKSSNSSISSIKCKGNKMDGPDPSSDTTEPLRPAV
jgi:hypothetical protein